MSDEFLDDHEQSEKVKNWLKDNFLSIVLGVAIGLGGLFGWQQWQVYQLEHKASAYTEYQAYQSEAELNPDAAQSRIDALRNDYNDTGYATMVQMERAAALVEQGEMQQAKTLLEQALQSSPMPALSDLINIRLARLEVGMDQAEQALDRLARIDEDSYPALIAEIRGDAHTMLNQYSEAKVAYEMAIERSSSSFGGISSIVQIKLDALPIQGES